MAIALVSSVAGSDAGGGSTFTTAAINTTGATLLVAVVTYYVANTPPILTDSKGNTWTPLAARSSTTDAVARIYYCANPTVGTLHDFTLTANGQVFYGSIGVEAFGDVIATSPLDAENGNGSTTGTSNQSGSVSPSENNELIVCALAVNTSSGHAIDSGFTHDIDHAGGAAAYRCEVAYLVQTSASAVNPTWSWTTSGPSAVAIATFKSAGGGGGSTTRGAPFGSRGTAFNGGRTFMGILR